MPTTHKPTFDEIAAILAPFERARLGQVVKTRTRVDVTAGPWNMVDADIRRVGADSFDRFFYSGCETIPYSDVRKIKVYAWDESATAIAWSRTYDLAEQVPA